MVRPGRESFKRFLKTILNQLPAHVEQYIAQDQELLNDFLSVLQHHEEAEFQRKKLSKRFERYIKSISGTDQYLQTPFLWFSFTYFSNARLLLSVSRFHANLFYEYLVKHLRGNNGNPGVYRLVCENTPLSDLTWEQLQHESNKLIVPLTEDQLQILNTVYSFTKEAGIYSLDPQKLREAIVKQVSFPRNQKPFDELKRFFTRVNGRWALHFFSHVFGLDRLNIQIELQESTSLEEIIDFNDTENTVLTISDVFEVRGQAENYIMTLYVPIQAVDCLERYFLNREKERSLILKDMSRVITTNISASLNQYKANVGWIEPTQTQIQRITRILRSTRPPNSKLFYHPPFNNHWDFKQHPLPVEIIKLYSNIPLDYSYSNLPLNNHQDLTHLTRKEIGLLKQLYYNRVVYTGFVPWRLVYEFSLDLYGINLPKIPFIQLQQFLILIPFSQIYFTEKLIHIRARVTPKLVRWIERDLEWTIFPIIRKQYRLDLEFNWFDSELLQWRTPGIIDQ
ncbi:MAG: hypothetical protein ACFFC6_00465 [Promethearchaeota archaeon]